MVVPIKTCFVCPCDLIVDINTFINQWNDQIFQFLQVDSGYFIDCILFQHYWQHHKYCIILCFGKLCQSANSLCCMLSICRANLWRNLFHPTYNYCQRDGQGNGTVTDVLQRGINLIYYASNGEHGCDIFTLQAKYQECNVCSNCTKFRCVCMCALCIFLFSCKLHFSNFNASLIRCAKRAHSARDVSTAME